MPNYLTNDEPDECNKCLGECLCPDLRKGTPDTAILAAADELIRCGYANTNGLITRDALRYRIVGIIARYIKV